MATKVKTGVIDSSAITSALIANASITADDLHATLDLTGKTVTVATASAGDNDTSVASTAFVSTAIANLADSAPSTLNTLNELAAALGDDANYATTTTNAIAAKAPIASPTFTTTITTPDINITGGSQIGQDYAYLKSNSTSNASLTLRKDSSGADSIDFLQLRSDGNGLIGKIEGDGDISFNAATFAGAVNGLTLGAGGISGPATNNFALNTPHSLRINIDSDNNATDQDFIIGNNQTAVNQSNVLFKVQENGNVGIGTSSPDEPLHIYGSGYQRLKIQATGSGDGADLQLKSKNDSTQWILFNDSDSGNNSGVIKYVHSTNKMHFRTNDIDDRLVIDASGNVGIGTSSPSYKLEVNGQVISAEGLHSNNWQKYNTGTNGFLIGTNIAANNYAHIHGEIKLQQFNYNTQQIINFSATVAATGVATSAASSDIPVTIKLFMYAGTWYIWVPSPSTYTDISAYIHMGDGYQGTSRSSNAITSLSSAGVPSSGVTNSVDIIAKIAAPGSVIQTVYATNTTLVVPSQTINDYTTFIQVNITPKYATSKILITGIAGVEVSGGNYPTVHCRLYRDSTHIKSYLYWGYEGAQTTHRILNEPMHYLDSPTTTSALTYYAKLANSSGSSYSGTYSGKAHAYNPSTFMVQEIAQ